MLEPTAEIVNIGRLGARRRRIFGASALGAATLLVLYLDVTHATRWWRLTSFPLVWVGFLGWLEARARTCVVRSRQGVCELDDGSVTEMDAASRDLLSHRAKSLAKQSALFAVAVTLAAFAFP